MNSLGVPEFMLWPLPDSETSLFDWQDGRCAFCGVPAETALVTDHDHATGLVRGLLCRSCNASEPHSDGVAWVRYRNGWTPATVLGIEQEYWSPFPAATREPVSPEMRERMARIVAALKIGA